MTDWRPGGLTPDDAAMSQFGQRRFCLHKPNHRANTVPDPRHVCHDVAPQAGVEPSCSRPGPAVTGDDDGT